MSCGSPRLPALLAAALVAVIALPVALQAAPAVRAPVVMGTAHVGGTLTAKVAMPAAKGTTYVFQWQTQKKVTVKKKTVTRWVAISRASKATFVPPAVLKGSSVRACVKAKGTKSAWKCSGAKVVAAALTPAAPTPAAPAPPNPLSVSYLTQRFITGSAGTVLSPTTTGGSGTKRFEVTAGTLPGGITFDQGTGTFTGPAASAWNFRATQITAGDLHTCALTTTGGVKCWGSGSGGELGNGATSSQSTPVDVVATGQGPGGTALSGITQITAGKFHTCALTTSGGVKCWGNGASGQLGNGDTPNPQSTPLDVVATGEGQGGTALSRITQIAAGDSHTCALTTSGGVKCWGSGSGAGLGNGATSDQSTPVDVVATGQPQGGTALSGVTQIAAGTYYTCALTTSGRVKCWGYGAEGRLGNGATSNQSTPVDVVATGGNGTLSGVTQITAGDHHTCALTTSGGVKCWGRGTNGQLGNGATLNTQSTPVDVCVTAVAPGVCNGIPLRGISQITAGANHTCALTTSGGVTCWGSGSGGELGNGAESNQSTPVDVVATGEAQGGAALSGITQITAGFLHTCALTTSGGVQCWGRGAEGQLGNDATPNPQSTPVDVTGSGAQIGFPAALTVTSRDDTGSTNTSVNLTEVSRPWFSYPNALFTMGQDQQQLAPVVRGGSGTKDFSVSGTLPDGVTFDRVTGTFTGPAPSAWNFRATQITAGSSHTCALTTSGGVKCWGSGFDGQLGNGATSDQSTPVDVLAAGENPGGTALSGITQIATGAQHTCALTTSGGVQCWGYGFRGQIGNGDTSDQSTPVDVLATGGSGNLSGVAQITAGGFHTCALTTSGGVKCWGGGTSGQLGNRATPTEQSTPVNVVAAGGSGTLSDVTQITGGLTHTCALTTTRGVKCWGRGADGQLGNGATSGHSTPVDVVASGGFGTLSNATQITAGDSHTCALTTTRGVKCWGYGDDGQLGNGATSNQSTPVDVATYVGNGLLSGVAQITAGGYHTCALATSGGVKCWGRGTNGQLGNDATPNPQSTPVDVVAAGGGGALSDGNQITAGFLHTCALTTSGGVQCWGRGAVGQLGNGANPTTQLTPVDVTRSGEQPGFPAVLSVTVTDDTGSWTLGRVVLGTK